MKVGVNYNRRQPIEDPATSHVGEFLNMNNQVGKDGFQHWRDFTRTVKGNGIPPRCRPEIGISCYNASTRLPVHAAGKAHNDFHVVKIKQSPHEETLDSGGVPHSKVLKAHIIKRTDGVAY